MNDYGFVCVRHEAIKTANSANNRQKHSFDKSFRDTLEHINHDKTEQNIELYYNYDGCDTDIMKTFKDMSLKYQEAHNKKLRKDAVKAIETVYAISNGVIDMENPERVRLYADAIAKCHKKYAQDCPFKIVIQVDEKTIHGHAFTIPYNSKGEAFRNKILSPKALKQIQDDFALCCQENDIDVVRGIPKKLTNAEHQTSFQYAQKQAMKEASRQAEAELQLEVDAERKSRLKAIAEEEQEAQEQAQQRIAKSNAEAEQAERRADVAWQDVEIAEEEAKQAQAKQRFAERKTLEAIKAQEHYEAKAEQSKAYAEYYEKRAKEAKAKFDDYGQFFDLSKYDEQEAQKQAKAKPYNIDSR